MKRAGFTLIEVLVALVILAVALTAAMRAANAGIDSASDTKARFAAGLVVKNRIAELQSGLAPSDLTRRTGVETQAGVPITWTVEFTGTPNPLVRRAAATASTQADPGRQLASLTAYVAQSGTGAP
jgi:general secretion pathway protein I